MIPVKIQTRKWIPKRFFKRFIRKYHLSYDRTENGTQSFSGSVSKSDYAKLKALCRTLKVGIRIDNRFSKRSSDYRKIFFENNPPDKYGGYFCSYCGRHISKKYITVDHLYPVKRAGESVRAQKKLKKKGFMDINDPRNLVAACKRCNERKGSKTGLWILKGKIGRYAGFWYFKYTLQILLAVLFFIVLARHLATNL